MRYLVNATVVSDAWVYIEADDDEAALDQASTLTSSELESGDTLDVQIESVVRDA
jgi:hypothetical protein